MAKYFFSEEEYWRVNLPQAQGFFESDSSFFFFETETEILCPHKSTFCFIEGKEQEVCLEKFLALKKNKPIIWSNPANFYPGASEQLNLLLKHSFEIHQVDINQHLEVNEDFYLKLNSSKRNLLNKVIKLGIETKILHVSYLSTAYQLIQENRRLKKHPLTMPFDKLERLVHNFPDKILFIGSLIEDKLIACSFAVKISNEIIYQFQWAHDSKYDKLSPLLHLNQWTYQYAQKNGFRLIDLGISSVKGEINKGLFTFKKEMGAKLSKKYSLTLDQEK